MEHESHNHHHHHDHPGHGEAGLDSSGGLVDPVCGMRVGADVPESQTYERTLYRF